ncbi:hypothetical protein Tco_0338394, partial [Tanacetum coccineum]
MNLSTIVSRIHHISSNGLRRLFRLLKIILIGIGNDIYSTIDACPNVCEMWKAIERLKQDHAGCLDSRKSTSGGIQFLGGDKLVSWSSKKQDCTS